MSALVRGCLEFLLFWGLAGLGLFTVFQPRFTAPGPEWSGVVGGFLVAAAWGLVRNAWLTRSQASLVRDSLLGAMPLGERPYAAIGQAIATDQPLATPFQHRPCVLYSYELSQRNSVRASNSRGTRNESQKIVYFSGLAMTDWAVQTQSGPVRVCGFPIPDQFDEVVIDTDQNHSRIREFCDQTEFTRVGKWEIGSMLNFAGIVLREAGGPVREDLWFEGADEVLADRAALKQCRLIEQAIHVDQQICVIGKFDQLQNGLVNDLKSGGLQVLAGEPSQALRQLRATSRMYLILALILFSLGTLGSYVLLSLRELEFKRTAPAELSTNGGSNL